MEAWGILSRFGFGNLKRVTGRSLITEMIRGKDKSGIFVLFFKISDKDYDYYVGMSDNIPSRYQQIRIEQGDIEYIAYKQVQKSFHEEEKKAVIQALEKQFTIRNIAQAARPETESQLDIVVSKDKQKAWLKTDDYEIDRSSREVNNTLRKKYVRKFSELNNNPFFHSNVLPVLKKYVTKCIIEPFKTEISFWGCSCLPDSHPDTKNFEVYSRIDIFWQEVFTIGQDLERKLPVYSWHLKKSSLSRHRNFGKGTVFADIKTFDYDDHHYPKGGDDQFNVWVHTAEDALAILDIHEFVLSAKEFNLRNMKRGAQVYAPNHCMDLADLLLAQ